MNKRMLKIPHRIAFTPAALRQWDALDHSTQAQILNNAWCGVCRQTTHIQVRSAEIDRRDLLLIGKCSRCGGSVARDDATHVALAAVHRMDFLVTWNCRHIDNAEAKPLIRSVCAVHGYTCPEICTPEELMGGPLNEG